MCKKLNECCVMSSISPSQLKKKLKAQQPPILLNLDPEEAFKAGHIAGSLSCVLYEMGFADRVKALIPGLESEVVVYATDADSYSPVFAAEKLARAGYTSVKVLQGGLEDWAKAGFAIEGALVANPSMAPGCGTFDLDLESSRLRWVGRNLANAHEGTVRIKSGSVTLKAGELKSGQLILDMKGIECRDIADTKLNRILIAHLEDHDFFDTERYPEAEVRMGRVTLRKDVTPGQANYVGEAILTLRGVVHGVSFELAGGVSDDQFSLQGALKFDRTDWGVLYGSARYFKRLGMHLVNDLIDLDIRLNFKRRV